MGISRGPVPCSFVWVLLLWLSAIGIGIVGVESATDCAPLSGSLTVRTSQDVSSLAQCSKFTGNIVVAADGPNSISLDGLISVAGNIDIENVATLSSLSSRTLTTVSSFTLNKLPQLSNLSFPALTNFSSMKWYNLPALENCEVATGAIEGEIKEITIFNTSLKGLDWLKWPVGSQLNITSNAKISAFSIPFNTINSGSAYTLSSNPALKDIDLSSLTGIYGGLDIDGNNVASLTFTKLETIGGFVQLSGAYTNISMPALNQINGALSVDSSNDIKALCDSLDQKKLTGHFTCNSNVEKSPSGTSPTQPSTPRASGSANPAGPNGSSDGKGNERSGIDKSAKIGIAIAAFVITILLAIGAFFYFRRRSRAKVREISYNDQNHAKEGDSVELSESGSNPTSPKELESPVIRLELTGGKEILELPGAMPQELDAQHGWSEMHTPITPVSPAASLSSVHSGTALIRHELPA